ncbi:MAG: electron transfer flavoprotein subunit alpha/FixB family protein [Planctomycetota bacterium]
MADIFAFAEQKDGKFKRSALEAVAEAARHAKALAGSAVALVLGPAPAGAEKTLGASGATRMLAVEGTDLLSYSPEVYAKAIADVVAAKRPGALFFSATSRGKDLAPRVAAHLGVPAVSDCTRITLEGNRMRARRPVYAGKAFIEVSGELAPFVATLRPNVFPLQSGPGTALSERITASPPPAKRSVLKDMIAGETGKVELTEAAVIVSGGRGLKGKEHFSLVENLAQALGAAVGASRAVVDVGWRPHSEQVGQTGKTVTPNLYFACGISRGDPASRRHVRVEVHRRDQQGPRGAHLQGGRLRHRRRCVRGAASLDRRAQPPQDLIAPSLRTLHQ